MSLRPRIRVAGLVASLALAASLLAPSATLAAPEYYTSIDASFASSQIAVGGSTTLTVDITGSLPHWDMMGFAFMWPDGMAMSNIGGSCDNGNVWLFTYDIEAEDFDRGSGVHCHLTVTVTGVTAGTYHEPFVSQGYIMPGGYILEHTDDVDWATLTVVAPPTVTAAFASPTMAPGATDTLTIHIANPSPNTMALTGVGFSSALPAGLTLASGSGSACGGTFTTTAPSSMALSGATIAADSACEVQVVVTGVSNGGHLFVTGPVSSVQGGAGSSASAGVTVVTWLPPTITAHFGTNSLQVGDTTTLTFTVANPNAGANAAPNVAKPAGVALGNLTGIGFTDGLPSGLVIATPNGLTGSCGGGAITATAGSTTITLTGASLAAGASCQFVVTVLAQSAGVKVNSTGSVGSDEAAAGDPGSDTLTVGSATLPPATLPPVTLPPTTTGSAHPAGSDSGSAPAIALVLAFGLVALAFAFRRRRVQV